MRAPRVGPRIERAAVTVYKTSSHRNSGPAMDYRDPITLIDDSIENLTYLIDWLLEDIDAGAVENEALAKDAIRAIAALRAIHALLPRLRIVRSNFESWPSLPDARKASPDQVMGTFIERGRARLRRHQSFVLRAGPAAEVPHSNGKRDPAPPTRDRSRPAA